jgi:hypothetical protein
MNLTPFSCESDAKDRAAKNESSPRTESAFRTLETNAYQAGAAMVRAFGGSVSAKVMEQRITNSVQYDMDQLDNTTRVDFPP